MRHKMRGRKLGRNASHRRAMFRNMASSLIRSVRVDEDDPRRPKVPGRITTTVPKAKELRPFVERLVTMARKALTIEDRAEEFATSAERGSAEWKSWRESEQWNKWNQAIAPAVALRRRAFALLRDQKAVSVLFDELAERFEDRPGGYTRVVKLAKRRLGDAGEQALIEFVGDERDRKRRPRSAPRVVVDEPEQITAGTATETEEETATATAVDETSAEATEADVAAEESQGDQEDSNK